MVEYLDRRDEVQPSRVDTDRPKWKKRFKTTSATENYSEEDTQVLFY